MPKIRLSALASDMKGKLQGSVFSTNSGGVYFRNNPSGGGRKSELWAKQKNKFSSVASAWRSLTTEQQDAWESARTLYPTTNAFGEPRIPTAYELYMRLNSALYAQGFGRLQTPAAPRTFPAIESVEFDIPDQYVFSPKTVVNLQPKANHGLRIMSQNIPDFMSQNQGGFVACRYNLNSYYKGSLPLVGYYPLLRIEIKSQGFIEYILRPLPDGTWTFCIFGLSTDENGMAFNFFTNFYIDKSLILNEFHFSAFSDFINNLDNSIFINGECLYRGQVTFYDSKEVYFWKFLGEDPSSIPTPVFQNMLQQDTKFIIGSFDIQYRCPYNLSDFRWIPYQDLTDFYASLPSLPNGFYYQDWDCLYGGIIVDGIGSNEPTSLAALYTSFGYVLGCEQIWISLDDLQAGYYQNYGLDTSVQAFMLAVEPECTGDADCTDGGYYSASEVECVDGICVYVGEPGLAQSPSPYAFGPLIFGPAVSSEDDHFNLVIQASVPRGSGRAYNHAQFVDLYAQPLDNNYYFYGLRWKQLFANCPNDAVPSLKVYNFDSSTGAYDDAIIPVARPPRNKPRFKVGAETSGKVN